MKILLETPELNKYGREVGVKKIVIHFSFVFVDLAKRADDQAIGYINELFSDIMDEHEQYERGDLDVREVDNMHQHYPAINNQYRQIAGNHPVHPVRSTQESETGEINQPVMITTHDDGRNPPVSRHRQSKKSNISHVSYLTANTYVTNTIKYRGEGAFLLPNYIKGLPTFKK